jgi:hypothetical protein
MSEPTTQWDALLSELREHQESLAKSISQDDDAEEKDEDGDEEEDAAEVADDDKKEDDEDAAIAAMADSDADDDGVPNNEDEDELFGKSMSVLDQDGKPMRAYDGTELVKSLMDQQETMGNQVRTIAGQVGLLIRALTGAMEAKDAEIKALKADASVMRKALVNVAGKGRSRKSVLTIHDKAPDTAPAAEPGPAEIMKKANSAAEAGKITWREYASVDAAIRMKKPVNPGILSRIGD